MDGKLVFNSYIAKQLLTQYNHQIIDLKKHNNGSVIFIFRKDKDIEKHIQDISNNSTKGVKTCQRNKQDMQI